MSFKKKAIHSTKWVTISTAFQTILQFVQIAILARLLSADAFGIVGISTTIINFFGVFSNLGFSNSIIYKQESDRKVLSTVYFLNILIGILIFITIYTLTPFLVSFYGEPRLNNVIRPSALMFLIVFYGTIYTFLMQKELRFKSVALIDIAGALSGTTLTIFLAYRGYEELSLVYGGLLMYVIRTILQIVLGRKLFTPFFYFNLSEITDHLKFGIYNLGEGVVNFVQNNWDNIVIGKMLGAKLLGYYTLAYQLAIFPVNKLNPIILQVAYPILAKMKDNPGELKRAYLKILEILSYFNLPLLAGLYITAESIVPLIYGPNWEPTFPLIKIFVFVSVCTFLSHPLFTLVYTKGKPSLLFYLTLITLFIKIPLVYILGTHYGIMGIATAFLLTMAINTIINFFIVDSLIGSFMKNFFTDINKPILFCLLMVALVACYQYFVGYEGWINAIAQIAIGGIIYMALVLKFKLNMTELKALKLTILNK